MRNPLLAMLLLAAASSPSTYAGTDRPHHHGNHSTPSDDEVDPIPLGLWLWSLEDADDFWTLLEGKSEAHNPTISLCFYSKTEFGLE